MDNNKDDTINNSILRVQTLEKEYDLFLKQYQEAYKNYINILNTSSNPCEKYKLESKGVSQECYNKIWSDEFNDMFLNALAYCIINLQDKILNDTIFIDVDYLNGNFLSYWDNCGSTLNKKEDRGVMSYIIEVAADYLITNSNNEFLIQTDNMFKRTYKVINKYYSENLERMKKKDDICREKKKEQKGKIEKDKLLSLYKNKE